LPRRYVPPEVDESQDISEASLTREDGVNILRFKKQLNTGDDMDVELTAGSVYLVFPESGGDVFSGRFIGKHEDRPAVAADFAAFPSCGVQLRNGGLSPLDANALRSRDVPYSAAEDETFAVEQAPRRARMIFSCSSTSNDKVAPGRVTFEDCSSSNRDFDERSGVFSCSEDGAYAFALTSLLKTEDSQGVRVKMMRDGADGVVSHVKLLFWSLLLLLDGGDGPQLGRGPLQGGQLGLGSVQLVGV